MSRVWEIFDDDDAAADIKAEDADEAAFMHHPAIEISLHASLRRLRQIAVDACPLGPAALLAAQRTLLRSAGARLSGKGLSTDTETYRRLGILVPPHRYPADFARALEALRDYWQHHGRARSLGQAAPYRKVQQRAARYLRLKAGMYDGDADAARDPESLLPTPTNVRVFRLVNGNLEIPPTLFKALLCAGRLEDSFFPDEKATWGDKGGRRKRPPRATSEVVDIKDEDDDSGGGGGGGYGNVIDLTRDDDGGGNDPNGHAFAMDLLGASGRPGDRRLPIHPRFGGSGSSSSSSSTALHAAPSSAAPIYVINPTIQIMPSPSRNTEKGRRSSATNRLAGLVEALRSRRAAADREASVAPASRSTSVLPPALQTAMEKKRHSDEDRYGWRPVKRERLH